MCGPLDRAQVADHIDFGNVASSGLAGLGDAQLWLGLKSSDDQGTRRC